MSKLKELFFNWRTLLLILFLVASIVAINPKIGAQGVLINSVATNSSAELNGLQPDIKITSINGISIKNVADYERAISGIQPNDIIRLETNKGSYSFVVEEKNNQTFIGIEVGDVPKSNLKQGLDLVGGVRVVLKPDSELTQQQFDDLTAITQKRLNAFGLKDISVRQISNLQGDRFLLVEMAGTTEQQAINLVAQQGKFEAKIGNETVFVGGADIRQVCRSADCAFIETCNQQGNGEWVCQYQFKVDVSPESAKRHSEITRKLGTIQVGNEIYLEKKLDLYLDNELVESLYISESLRGIEATSFVIQGPGVGNTKEAAAQDALARMKQMQTILITGALPVKLSIVKTDIVSPTLGEQFLKYAIISIIGALIAVAAIVFTRYRKLKIATAVLVTGFSEVLIILGLAALIHWSIDLAAIAAIIAAVGTGVDAQIIITDETISGEKLQGGWKERMKRAFFIVFGSYATLIAAMLPLWAIGSTMLKGFAIITIIGASIGVFITRPAYARFVEVLLK
ncbi:MAG: site-2 protease family protein [Candidatus Nanoarchaeia archaeon]